MNSEFGTGTPQDPRTILLIGDIRAIGDVSDIPQAVTEFITFCFNIFLSQPFVYNQQSRSPLDLMECFLYFPPKTACFFYSLAGLFSLKFLLRIRFFFCILKKIDFTNFFVFTYFAFCVRHNYSTRSNGDFVDSRH